MGGRSSHGASAVRLVENGHPGVSPDMAIRLEKVFGSTADTWLRMQMQRDLWEARQRADAIKVNKRFATAVLC
jgi:plasmid maintenance system antidote protein VapI